MMHRVFLFFALFLLSNVVFAQSTSDEAQVGVPGFVSNELFIYMRAGPGGNFRFLGTITAGTPVQRLDSEDGYVQIIDDRQRTGWIEQEYFTESESLQVQLAQAQEQVAQLSQNNSQLASENNTLARDLEATKKQSQGINRELTEQLEKLSVIEQEAENQARQSNVQWLTRGAIIALGSLFIGYVLGSIARKHRSRNRLM